MEEFRYNQGNLGDKSVRDRQLGKHGMSLVNFIALCPGLFFCIFISSLIFLQCY